MTELVHERAILVRDEDGIGYDSARVYAEPVPGGTWAGFIEFQSVDRTRVVRSPRDPPARAVPSGDLPPEIPSSP